MNRIIKDHVESSANVQVKHGRQPVTKPNVVCRLSEVMQKFGEVHNMLARTTLPKEEYNPISNLLAVAKVELFNIYYDLKNEI